MKKINVLIKSGVYLLPFLILLLFPACSSSESQSNMNGTARSGYNIDELNSYGEWIYINKYGNVWQPYVVNSWMPFDNGYWTYADANWTWVSYEPFGWIVYHYGYWYDDPFYGWVWIPSDNAWSPARVMWVDYDNYIGWAPLPPAGVVYGNPWESNGNRHWHVVRQRDFTEDNIHNYRVINPVRNQSRIRDAVINKPPARVDIEKSVGKPITDVKIQHETIKIPETNIEKINLPPQEHKRVEQNSPRVRKEVLVPRDEFHNRQNERKQESSKETRKK